MEELLASLQSLPPHLRHLWTLDAIAVLVVPQPLSPEGIAIIEALRRGATNQAIEAASLLGRRYLEYQALGGIDAPTERDATVTLHCYLTEARLLYRAAVSTEDTGRFLVEKYLGLREGFRQSLRDYHDRWQHTQAREAQPTWASREH